MARKGENIFKRKDGRWEGRYIKEYRYGKAVYGYVFGKTYKEAKEKKAAAVAALSTGADNPKVSSIEQPYLREICSQWLAHLELIRKKSTIVKYRNQLDQHILPFFGSMRIDMISNQDLISFINGLLDGSGNNGHPLSAKTVSDILSRIKSIHRFAMIHGCDVRFVPDCVTIPQHSKEVRVLTFAEETLLLQYLRTNLDLTSLGILVCLFTGIRIGELCALMWSDISLDDQELHVCRTMQRLQKMDGTAGPKTKIEIDEPKSKCSIRTIPIPDNIMDDLRSAYTENAYLLTGHPQLFVEPRTMENRFKAILKKCGIADANYHALRHSFATRCIEAGFDIKSLSEILGHANVNITLNRYVHPTMQLKHENMNRLSALFAVR